MPQPNVTIQDSLTTQHMASLWFNRNQFYRFRYFGTTTDNVATEIFVDGISGNRVKVPDASATVVHAMCVIHNTTDGFSGGVGKTACVENIGGTVALAGSEQGNPAIFGDNTNNPGGTVVIAADNTNDAFTLTATGTAAKTIYYECIVDVICATVPESNFGRVN